MTKMDDVTVTATREAQKFTFEVIILVIAATTRSGFFVCKYTQLSVMKQLCAHSYS